MSLPSGVRHFADAVFTLRLRQAIPVRRNPLVHPAEHLPHIFDPFYTTRASGTGLGLAVVAMTVNQHGGDISALNHPAGGAEFFMSLPMLAQSE